MRGAAASGILAVWKRAAPRNRMREILTSGSVGGLAEQSLALPGHSLPYLGDSSAAGSHFRGIDEYLPYWCQKSFSTHLLRSRYALAG